MFTGLKNNCKYIYQAKHKVFKALKHLFTDQQDM